jgi:Rrf2 family protein
MQLIGSRTDKPAAAHNAAWRRIMAAIVRVSDAFTLAVHAVILLAAEPGRRISAGAVSRRFRVSGAHLAKVMHTLARAGLVGAARGPHGGAWLTRPAGQVTLLQVYEAIEGPMRMEGCLLAPGGCGGACCRLGSRLAAANDELRALFARTTLADLARQLPEAAA